MKSVCILGYIASEMRKIFSIPCEFETRVWATNWNNSYDLLSNMEYTTQEARLYQGQVHILTKVKVKSPCAKRRTRPEHFLSAASMCAIPVRSFGSASSFLPLWLPSKGNRAVTVHFFSQD